MPDTDGITLLKEWAANGQLTMPVIMMSGHATIDTAVEATRIGALDFLEKPIGMQKLLAAVSHGLERGQKRVAAGLSLAAFPRSAPLRDLKKRLEQVAAKSRAMLLRSADRRHRRTGRAHLAGARQALAGPGDQFGTAQPGDAGAPPTAACSIARSWPA